MAANSRLLRALQIISDTSRKINPTVRPTPTFPTVLKSLPEHKPLLPLLLSFNIPPKLAKECADKYNRCASKLRLETETKLAPYLVNRRRNKPTRVYTMFLNNYDQALRDWAQSILDVVLKTLKRDPVKLGDWDVTYPAPLWLPSTPDLLSAFARSNTPATCPLSTAPTPAHAFPTTYPPPLRPPPGLGSVEWRRLPATSSNSPSTSIVDLDSLCLRFSNLLIDENPTQPQQKASIFSLPAVPKAKGDSNHVRTKPSRRRISNAQRSWDPRAHKLASTSPLRTPGPRQLSVPPSLPSFSSTTKPSRKASAPACVSCSQPVPPPSQPLDSITHDPDSRPSLCLSIPLLYPQPLLNNATGQTTYTQRVISPSTAGPTTPPALLPDLFSEAIIVPSTPVHLSPRSSLMSITDPFLQFQQQYDYFSNSSLISAFGSDETVFGLAAGGYFPKNAFDPPGLMPGPLENFLDPYITSLS